MCVIQKRGNMDTRFQAFSKNTMVTQDCRGCGDFDQKGS